MSKEQKKCIFCKGTGMTKQHVFPQWLKNVVELPDPTTGSLKSIGDVKAYVFDGDGAIIDVIKQPFYEHKQGHVGSTALRIVCSNCNLGWMSSLEELAKPILTPLIKRGKVTLVADEITILARWVFMTSIMHEYCQPNPEMGSYTLYSEIENYRLNNKLPVNWNIYIGYTEDKEWIYRRIQHSRRVYLKEDLDKGITNCYSILESIAFGLGNVFIMSFYSEFPNHELKILEEFGDYVSLIYKNNQAYPCEIKKIPIGETSKIDSTFNRQFMEGPKKISDVL